MKYYMYSVCDKYTCYDYPFAAYSDQAAIRQFEEIINEHKLCKNHPGDYDLYKVGSFDTSDGVVESITPHEAVSTGMNVIRKDKDAE